MNSSEARIVRKALNWCKSVKKNISKYSYEIEDDYDDYDSYDECYSEDNFKEKITAQRERLDDLHVDLNDFLEDYDGSHKDELHQAQMAIDSASVELQDIENNYDSWDSVGNYSNQIVSAADSLDEAIGYLKIAVKVS